MKAKKSKFLVVAMCNVEMTEYVWKHYICIICNVISMYPRVLMLCSETKMFKTIVKSVMRSN